MPFRNPIVAGAEIILNALQSANFVQSLSGWQILKDGGAQFDSLNVVNNVGANEVDANVLTISGNDVGGLILANAGGVICDVNLASQPSQTSGTITAETILFQINVGSVFAGRTYLMIDHGVMTQVAVTGDVYLLKYRFTTDGSTPTLTSPELPGSENRVACSNNSDGPSFTNSFLYVPGADVQNLNVAVTVQRLIGTGFPQVNVTIANPGYNFTVMDMGLQTNVGGGIIQISGGSGGTPPSKHTEKFAPSWSQSSDSDGTNYQGGDSNRLYQGFDGNTHGNTRSSFGDFRRSSDNATLLSVLSGASSVSMVLHFHPNFTNNPFQGWIFGTAANISNPGGAVWNNLTGKSTNVFSKSGGPGGAWFTVNVPGSVVSAFQAGSVGTLLVGPGLDGLAHYFGYGAGVGQANAPYLEVTYSK